MIPLNNRYSVPTLLPLKAPPENQSVTIKAKAKATGATNDGVFSDTRPSVEKLMGGSGAILPPAQVLMSQEIDSVSQELYNRQAGAQ